MCHLSPQDQHVCQSHHGIAEAITGVLGRAQFPSCSFYHPRSSCSRFRPTRKAAICAGNFPDSNGIVMISKGKHVPIRLNQCLLLGLAENIRPSLLTLAENVLTILRMNSQTTVSAHIN